MTGSGASARSTNGSAWPGGSTVLRLTSSDVAARDVQSLGTVGLRHSQAVSPTQDIVDARVVRDDKDLRAIRLVCR